MSFYKVVVNQVTVQGSKPIASSLDSSGECGTESSAFLKSKNTAQFLHPFQDVEARCELCPNELKP